MVLSEGLTVSCSGVPLSQQPWWKACWFPRRGPGDLPVLSCRCLWRCGCTITLWRCTRRCSPLTPRYVLPPLLALRSSLRAGCGLASPGAGWRAACAVCRACTLPSPGGPLPCRAACVCRGLQPPGGAGSGSAAAGGLQGPPLLQTRSSGLLRGPQPRGLCRPGGLLYRAPQG